MRHETGDLRLETSDMRLRTSESRYASGVSGLLFLLLFIFLWATNTEAAPKRHKVTVGMYNTYSIQDGNLGRAEPDLKEVWEGVPGVSEFEACNMTMHYWPRPGDLPQVEAGENRYSAWWKGYMEEAYNLTNQDGEVRLKVIVGPLYSYYAAYRGGVFDGFIEDLCKWEKGSVYEGTLAGWYLTEEPMGSTHNFDPDVNSQMAEAIKAVEKSVGVPHHRMYIDVGTAGKYYSSSGLAAFTRPVDVVMVSAGPFLWTTSGKQPVYEPDWSRIHVSTSKIREVVYSDRDRRKMPRPEIHVVLEGRDAIGHGQPTNWEMRQQIHVSLSQSVAHNDPPADGIWFFWWSEIGINKNNDDDDWNHGRRLAEAIQTQVPRSTFEQNPWERKDYDPPETRFRFPELGSFNPTYLCIPYDLAEPGYVRIEILDENLSLVKSFGIKYQVAGELRRFGGPYWNRSGARNGSYIFRLYLNSKLMDEVKVRVQWSITVNSTSHLPGVWSSDNVVEVVWEPQAEELEGLAGYSILWNTSPGSYPNTEIDLPPEVTSLRNDPLPDGDSNYFHIRSVNGAGQWSAAAHLGPFYIDTTEPGNVRDLEPDSHEIGLWSRDNRIIVHWNPAEDNASGVMGYSILWDNSPGTLPDKELDISGHTTILASEPLSDGQYYLHIRSVDNAGNWSHTAAHTGPFLIDTEPPGGVMELVSSSHVPGQWSNSDTVSLNWKDASDLVSGVAGYSVLWDDMPDTVPDESVDIGKQTSAISPSLESSADNAYYFHIRSVDAAGNWSAAAHLGPFYIDTTEPANVKDLESDSHEIGLWSRNNRIMVHWDPAEDNASGVMGYSILWDNEPGTLPDKELVISSHTTILASEPLSDGQHYLHVRSVDNAGNWAYTAAHIGPFLIDTEPPGGAMGLVSSSHVPGQWSGSNTVSLNWKDAPDLVSGVVGYSILWDDVPDTIPDESVDIDKQTSTVSPTLESSADRFYYFHIRGVDAAGNWSDDAAHAGPFLIDTEPPPKVDGLASTSHNPDEWSPLTSAYIAWNPTEDGISGIARYEWNISQDETVMGEWKETTEAGIKLDIPDDGVWYFRVRAVDKTDNRGDSEGIVLKVDSRPPSVPTVWSSSHPDDGAWYTDPEVAFQWRSADGMSGIDGYNWSWDTNARMVLDDAREMDAGSAEILVTAESPGVWYFHLRAVDKAGNWSDTAHHKVQIDPSAPPAPQISSDTHIDGGWSIRNDVNLSWETPGQGPSGILGYSFMLDHDPMSTPDEVADTGDGTYADLPDGILYFHCRAKGGSGIWGPASHYEIRIDTTPPEISITYPQSDVWYTEPITTYSGRVEDYTSGVDWNSLQYSFGDQWISFRSDTAQQGTTWSDQDEIPHCGETHASYLSVRVWDEAGNLRISDPVTIKVDQSISLPTISSPTHPDQDRWYSDNRPEFLWNFIDNYSGLDSFSWALDHSESTVPPEISMTSDTYIASTKALSDGVWYFHVRARDRAGNWSEAAHYRVKIDTISPLATVKIFGPVVMDHKPPLVRAGRVKVLLQISEPVQKATLKYQTSSADYPIELIQTGETDEWEGFFDVTADTGDGEAVFSFTAYDEAGNMGSEITTGESFAIDTTPPTARLKISGPAVVNRDPLLVRSGPVEVVVQASEKIFEPSLMYKPSGGAAAVPVELTGDDRIVWRGSFGVSVHTGDGEAAFTFSARDEAGNPGSEITGGSSFVVDTLIRAGAYDTVEVLCVTEPATKISLPPGAITQDLRIEIVKDTAGLSSSVLGVYDFIAYNGRMKKLDGLVFRVPVEITFSPELPPGQTGEGMLGIYYWDGVRQHKIQDTWTTLRVDYLGRFTLMRSEPMISKIVNGWAAPNPFTPNGSGDATDRTVFHVATQRGSADFTVRIYDLNGRLVKSLEDGRRVWDGTDEDGKLVEGGLYIYQIKSGEQIISGTVVVLK